MSVTPVGVQPMEGQKDGEFQSLQASAVYLQRRLPGTASLVNVTLNMRYEDDKNMKYVITRFVFFQAQNAPRSVFGWDSAPDPAVEAYDVPQTPKSAHPPPRPPVQHKILASPVSVDVYIIRLRNATELKHLA